MLSIDLEEGFERELACVFGTLVFNFEIFLEDFLVGVFYFEIFLEDFLVGNSIIFYFSFSD